MDSNATPPLRARRRWAAEAVLIVLSVALGFVIARFEATRSDRQLADRALASLVDEIEENLAVLEPLVPVHDAWVSALAGARSAADSGSGIDVFFATRPPLPPGTGSPFPVLQQSAWDAAVSGEAFRLIDYDFGATLSEIYRGQEQVGDNVDRLANGPIATIDIYDPSRRGPAVRLLWLTVADILAAERALLELYQANLPVLRTAVTGPR